MPNQDDITSIIKYFEESAKKEGEWKSVILSPLKVLTETPAGYCEGKEPILDENISISFLSPVESQNISAQSNLLVNIKSDAFLEFYKIYLDENQITEYTYPSLQSEDLVDIILNLSGTTEGSHTLRFEAFSIK
ncbi:hypothetical protein IJM86_03085 [bacterium]|nr:hypothetical protein [bacterium]